MPLLQSSPLRHCNGSAFKSQHLAVAISMAGHIPAVVLPVRTAMSLSYMFENRVDRVKLVVTNGLS